MTINNLRRGVLALALAGISQHVAALDFAPADDLSIVIDTRLSAGMAWRVQGRDANTIGIANGGTAFATNADDGNLAYEAGDVVSGVLKATSSISARWKDYGAFVRASAAWDGAQANRSYFDEADYGPGRVFGQDERRRKEAQIHRHIGHWADLLDAYVYANPTLFGQNTSLRVGRQVVNWGESTFVLNGLNSIIALNANRSRVPGFELDEVLIPTNQVWLSSSLPFGMNAEAFYQLQWERTIIDASGSFWSTNDFAGIGGTAANLGFGRADENLASTGDCSPPASPTTGRKCVLAGSVIPRRPDVTPDADGQYGVALRGVIEPLNSMELAAYYTRYHSRLPVFSGISRPSGGITPTTTAAYFVEYPKDIEMVGMSFNTTLPWDVAIQGEYSYKQGQPLQIEDIELLLAGLGAPSQINPLPGATLGGQYIRGWRRHNVSQADVGFTRIFGPNGITGADQTVVLLEAAATQVHDLPEQSVLRYEGPATYLPGSASFAASQGLPVQQGGYATPFSWGYKLVARMEYNNVLDIFTLRPTLRFDHDVRGTTPAPITNFVQNRRQVTASMGFTYRENFNGQVGYTTYFGAGDKNLLRDRDFISASVEYSF